MADENKVPLSYETLIYVDVDPSAGPTYEQINKGFTSFTPTNNPTVENKQYIGDINATTSATALQINFAYSGERVIGDAANDFFASLDGKVGNDLVTTLVKANKWEPADSPEGAYKAKLYNVVIVPTNPGDLAGGSTQAISGTVYVNGDPVEGTFDPKTKTFSPAAAA